MWEAATSNGRAPILYCEYRVGTSDRTIVRGARSADIADLTNGQNYLFEIRAVNAVGESPAARMSAIPQPGLPSAPAT